MDFRSRLLGTLRAIRGVLAEPGVLVVGSEVPNLLESSAASTLVVSEDVDILVPVGSHAGVKASLDSIHDLRPSDDEPSVWVPIRDGLIEVNFVGMDPSIRDAAETYVLEDDRLPLLVFGYLSLLRPGTPIEVDDLVVPVPKISGLLLEKLLTDRTAGKGDRDLLVVLGLLLIAGEVDLGELVDDYRTLPPDLRSAVRSSLTVLSLLPAVEGMPDPTAHRARVAQLLARLEGEGELRR